MVRGAVQRQFLAEPGAVRAFVAAAAPGETMLYARAASLPRGAETPSIVRQFAEGGQVTAHLRRSDEGCEYVIRRRAETVRRVTPRRGNGLGPLERAVLRLLKRYARTGKPIPSNRSIAARCGCKSRLDASWRIRKLVAADIIAIETSAEGERLVRILSKAEG